MRRNVQFINAAGHALSGVLEVPGGDVRAVALFAHCFTCNAEPFLKPAMRTAAAARHLRPAASLAGPAAGA